MLPTLQQQQQQMQQRPCVDSAAPVDQVIHGQHLPGSPSRLHGALPEGESRVIWAVLMDHAVDVEAPEVQALAGVLAAAWARHGTSVCALAGLSGSEHRRLLARWFPGAELALELDWLALARAPRSEARQDEIEDLVDLLTDTAAVVLPGPAAHHGAGAAHVGSSHNTHAERRWLAHALGQASLGDNHLWQDLHLPSRRELGALMARWFPALAARNDRDMKWKKFLYKQLCDRAEINACRAPSCSVCSDYARCFGPEDAVAA